MSTITVNANNIEIPNHQVKIGEYDLVWGHSYPLTVEMFGGSIYANPNATWWEYGIELGSEYGVYNFSPSMYLSGNMMSTQYFGSYSDKRIKNDIVELDDNESLNLINQLEVKKYKYKDIVKRSNTETYGFIAQQVEDVIPLATNTMSDYLPSIYELGDISEVNGNVLITTTNSLDLGNTEIYGYLTTPLNFRFYDNDNKQLNYNVIHVNDTTLQLDGNFSISNGNLFLDGNVVGNITEENKLFVYGPSVDDFKTLNKDKIFTVGISTIQELSRKNTTLENKVTTLETQLADVLSRLTALE